MPAGKLSAQTGHAFTDTLCKALDKPETANLFWDYRRGNAGSKVTLVAKNEAALHRILADAEAAGIPSALVTDEGHILLPHFTGEKIITAVGVGPCTKAQARPFLKKYQVVRDPKPIRNLTLISRCQGGCTGALSSGPKISSFADPAMLVAAAAQLQFENPFEEPGNQAAGLTILMNGLDRDALRASKQPEAAAEIDDLYRRIREEVDRIQADSSRSTPTKSATPKPADQE